MKIAGLVLLGLLPNLASAALEDGKDACEDDIFMCTNSNDLFEKHSKWKVNKIQKIGEQEFVYLVRTWGAGQCNIPRQSPLWNDLCVRSRERVVATKANIGSSDSLVDSESYSSDTGTYSKEDGAFLNQHKNRR